MSLANVVGFFTVGVVLTVLPRTVLTDATSASALWLAVMGGVMMAIGGINLAGMAWKTLPWRKLRAAVQALVLADEHEVSAGAKVEVETSVRG